MQKSKSIRKAGIFDPYLDTLGGGERYCLTVAEALLKNNWDVDLFWRGDELLKKKLEEKFSLKIDRVNFMSKLNRVTNLPRRFKLTSSYDLIFYLSDGSIPFLFGKKNILHFQVPFKNVLRNTLLNKIKLHNISDIVCNSFFTKQFIDRALGVNSKVIYPPVSVESFKPSRKEDVILFVGRFSQLLQNKKQDILVNAFKEMVKDNQLKDWKLILAGGSEVGGKEYVNHLKKISIGSPIEIIENPVFSDLVDLYGKAKFFWSASGFGVDEFQNPEKVEHFGITTVEAMAAGIVPIVLGKGGQKEIIEDRKNGFLWQTTEGLIKITLELLNDKKRLQQLSKEAIMRSKEFSKEVFYQKLFALL